MRFPAAAFSVALLSACAAHGPMSEARANRARASADGAWVAPTRTEEECQGFVARLHEAPPGLITGPKPAQVIIPPLDGAPRSQAGVRLDITLLVDLHGRVVADSTRIEPAIVSPTYDRRFRETLSRYEFHPAVIEGCAVPGRVVLVVELPR